jgi:predicted AlkP superfamily pyrophosphatase or phosphodiesterase
MRVAFLVCLTVYFACLVDAPILAQTPSSRLLVIGIDGCRPDSLAKANTPHLDRLIAEGGFSNRTTILGKYRKNDTVSGPGWSSFLTGVWADKHGVHDNSFEGKNYAEFPHFFQRVKERWPNARTGSFVNWEPIDKHIVQSADVRVVYDSHGVKSYRDTDALLAETAAEFLRSGQPHVAMVYFGAVDESGHQFGFHPTVPEYVAAIEQVDTHLGEVVGAMKQRSNYEGEDWLVIVSTDHGGRGKGHGGGHDEPEVLNTFLIVSGASAQKGTVEGSTFVVDVPVTGMTHLGMKIDTVWQLDGKSVGLRE